ncbi:MAG: pyrroloquinoline quinone-dependent dehydrogenase [Haloplanus sp.]
MASIHEHDEAVKAAQNIEMVEVDDGYTLKNVPEESVTHQHDVDQIPKKDVTQEMISNTSSNAESWLTYGGGYNNQRHTTADVITKDNVGDLELEYLVQSGVASSMEGVPLVVPGDPPIMYQTNGPNHAKAINARTGDVLWSYTYANPQGLLLCCDANNRGFAVYGDKVYMTTLDSGVVALNRYTGKEVWYKSTGDHEIGYSATWAPTIYKGQLITGSAGGEYGVSGFVASLDPENGDMNWKFNTTPPEQWAGDADKHGAGTTWMTRAFDEERDLLFSPMGNPGPDFDGTVRPGPNLYTIGTLALDANDGSFEWHYGESPHDIWDYDSSAPKILVRDKEINGETHDVVISPGKVGWVYTMDAESGKLLTRSEATIQHLNMWNMIPHSKENRRVAFVPGAQGGNDWQPPSYSPETGYVYVKQQNAPHEIFWEEAKYEAGQTYWGGGLNDWPDVTPPQGWNNQTSAIVAIDPVSGKRVWREWIQDDDYLWGGSITTGSGLLFAGTQKGNFVAFDGETGDRLWQFQLGAPICSSSMSWYDPGTSKQYVATQVGGSGWLHGGRRGATVAVFSLSE